MKKYMGKVSAVFLLFLMAIFWTVTISYNLRAVPRDRWTFRTLAMTSTLAGTSDDLFTVSGGRVEIVSFFGECTVSAGTPGSTYIFIDATAGAEYDYNFSTSVSIDSLDGGDVIRFTNAIDQGVLGFTSNVGAGQTLSWFCPPGTIKLSTSSGTAGTIIWYMTYRRLESGSRVRAN